MSGAPTLEQLKTVEIFRKKIVYLENILKKFYTFKYSRGDTLYYRAIAPEEDESKELALRSPTRDMCSIELRSLPGAIALKFWWNQEDIIVNKTTMNDFEYSKYIKKTNGGRYVSDPDEVLVGPLNLWSKFAPYYVLSSPNEVLQYDPLGLRPGQ